MEGAAPHGAGVLGDEFAHTFGHLLSGLIGEGEEHDVACFHAFAKEVSDSVRESAGFARTCASDDESWAWF